MANKPSYLKELIRDLRWQTDTPNQRSNWACTLNARSGFESTRPFCLLSSFPLSEDRMVYIFYQKVEAFLALGIMIMIKAAKLRASLCQVLPMH